MASVGIVLLARMLDRETDDYLARVDLMTNYGEQHSTAAIRGLIPANPR